MTEKPVFFEEAKEENASQPQAPKAAEASSSPFLLQWPSDYRVITQGFGANPELHMRRGLPGHEGLDIRAPLNATVYASAAGTVEQVQERISAGDPYGRWLRIRHEGGYATLYGHLSRVTVSKGAQIKAGQAIGQAGPTGDSAGSYIHLGLSLAGASQNGLSQYPDDIIDPTPFLFAGQQAVKTATYPWSLGRCLFGVAAGEGGQLGEAARSIEAVKLSAQASLEDIRNMRKQAPDAFLLMELRLEPGSQAWQPTDWAGRVRSAIQRHMQAGVAHFAIQRAPNLASEGWQRSWHSGREFGNWWLDVVAILRETFPLAKFGFPGLSAGEPIPGVRMDARTFMEQADEAILQADWIGAQAYWASSEGMDDPNEGGHYQVLRAWYPDKLLFITEAGSVSSLGEASNQQQQLADIYESIENEPGIGAIFQTN